MPARNRKGHFTKRARTRTRTRTITKYRTRHVGAKHHRRRGRRHHGSGGVSLAKLAIAGAGLAYVTNNVDSVKGLVAKIPGAKTFGAPATAGIALLAIDRFVKRNAWIRAAGYAGLAVAAMQVGQQGTNFKWLGDGGYDSPHEFTGDIEGDDDVGDYDE